MKIFWNIIINLRLANLRIRLDPCRNYKKIESYQRSTAYILPQHALTYTCDRPFQSGWYRFTSAAGGVMPTECPEENACGMLKSIGFASVGFVEKSWLMGAQLQQSYWYTVCDMTKPRFCSSIYLRNFGGFKVGFISKHFSTDASSIHCFLIPLTFLVKTLCFFQYSRLFSNTLVYEM